MDPELEIVGLAALGGWLKRRRGHAAAPVGSPCPNCATVLQGPYCHQCGQFSEDYHRSIGHLVAEAAENVFHFDGRLWRTLPRLIAKPGQLTRDYLDGHRAVQIPPLRLFLVVLLLVFFLGGIGKGEGPGHQSKIATFNTGTGKTTVKVVPREQMAKEIDKDVNIDIGKSPQSKARASWLKSHIVSAAHNPEQFVAVMETWAHRLAILMLPIGALLLALLFVFNRQFYLYDHLIFTMHSLSFQGLLLSVYFPLSLLSGDLAGLMVMVGAPTHLFIHMRGVYRRSVLGTLARMAVLFVGSAIAFVILLLALVWIALSAMTPH